MLALLGGVVMFGWWMQSSPLVRVLPGFTPMVFNTALCFVLAGSALLAPFSDAVRYNRVTTAIGGARYACTPWRYSYSPRAPWMTGIHAMPIPTIRALDRASGVRRGTGSPRRRTR